MADAAGPVAKHLNFDMPRPRHHLLRVNVIETEGGARLRTASFVRLLDVVGAMDGADAAAAAARDRLDHHRSALAERGEERARLVESGGTVGAAQNGNSRSFGEFARANLVAEEIEHLGAGADERDTRFGASPGERGILAQESVAGVNRVTSGFGGNGDYLFDIEIGRGALAAQSARIVRLADMERLGIVLGKDRDGRDAQFRGRAHDSYRNFATIGDQQPLQHLFRPTPSILYQHGAANLFARSIR